MLVAAAVAAAAHATAPAYSSPPAVVSPAGDGLAMNRRAHSTCSAVQLLAVLGLVTAVSDGIVLSPGASGDVGGQGAQASTTT